MGEPLLTPEREAEARALLHAHDGCIPMDCDYGRCIPLLAAALASLDAERAERERLAKLADAMQVRIDNLEEVLDSADPTGALKQHHWKALAHGYREQMAAAEARAERSHHNVRGWKAKADDARDRLAAVVEAGERLVAVDKLPDRSEAKDRAWNAFVAALREAKR